MNQQCDFCGKDYEAKVSPKGGRPSFYCSDTCRDAKKFWTAFQSRLDQIKLTDEARKLLRREVMRLVNVQLHDNSKRTKTSGNVNE